MLSPCLLMQSSVFFLIVGEEERAGCFTLIVIKMSCICLCLFNVVLWVDL